jgi:hypothetical protein
MLDDHPGDWLAHSVLGSILDDLDDRWAARNHLLVACAADDAPAEVANTLAVVYMGLGLLERAETVLEEALQQFPGHGPATRNLAAVRSAPRGEQASYAEVSGPLPACSQCPSLFVTPNERPVLCAMCSAGRPLEGACPCCGHDRIARLPDRAPPLPVLCRVCGIAWIPDRERPHPVVCPVCRQGEIVMKDHLAI